MVLLILPQFLATRPFELRMLTLICLFALMGQGWNVLGGYAGQVSIGHGLYYGLGAYTTALLAIRFGVDPWLGLLAGIALPAVCGVLVGIPCFRLRGHYFVIATLVVAESVFQIFTVWEWAGSAVGLEMPVKRDGWANFQFHRDKTPYFYIALAMLVGVTAGLGGCADRASGSSCGRSGTTRTRSAASVSPPSATRRWRWQSARQYSGRPVSSMRSTSSSSIPSACWACISPSWSRCSPSWAESAR